MADGLLRGKTSAGDVDDVIQETMAVLIQELPRFRHDLRRGAFRRWLRNITLNRLRVFWRTRPPHGRSGHRKPSRPVGRSGQLALSSAGMKSTTFTSFTALSTCWKMNLSRATWQAFRKVTLEGKTTAEAAAELGMSQVAVRIAKSRVLSRCRQEIAGLLD